MESFNSKPRDELPNRELFPSLAEARYVLDQRRLDYNRRRPHNALDWQAPPAFEANIKAQEDRPDGVFPSAMLADLPVGAAPRPPDQPSQSPPILSQGLDQET